MKDIRVVIFYYRIENLNSNNIEEPSIKRDNINFSRKDFVVQKVVS